MATTRPDASKLDEPCIPDITFVFTLLGDPSKLHPRPETPAISDVLTTSREHARLDRLEFDRCRDNVNPFRSEIVARLSWEKLPSILIDAGKPDTDIVIHLTAENSHQVQNFKKLEDTIIAKLTSGYDKAGRKGRWKFNETGWERSMA